MSRIKKVFNTYELGRLIEFRGKTVALINDRGYSVTTSKHISQAFSAVSHILNIGTKGDFDILKSVQSKKSFLEEEMKKHFKKLSFYAYSYKGSWLETQINVFNQFCHTLRLKKYQVKINDKYINEYNEHIQKRLARQSQLKSPELVLKREQKALKKAESDIVRWRQGGIITNAVRNLNPQLIRISGDTVQTSRGAEVPLKDARTLLNSILDGKAEGLILSQTTINGFKLTDFENNVVTIGCHRISLDDAKKVLVPLTLIQNSA